MTIAVDAADKRILVQPGRNAFPDMSAYISERFGFGPPEFQAEMAEKAARGERPW